MRISGADAMVKCLELEGVETLFGYPGVAIAPFFNSLYDSSIRTVLVRAEQNAGHAASGYARMTGRPGVCVATSGPGATNLVTALATAYADSIPMIAITGQVKTELLGRDVFQEVDITGATAPFTKHSYLVKDVKDIPRVFKEAFYIASTGRQGPVLIDMPIDIQNSMLNFEYPKEVAIRSYKPTVKGHNMQVKKVVKALKEAKRPVICSGGGVLLAHAEAEIRELCEKMQIPVINTMMGIGSMPSDHPLYFGMLGDNGKPYANRAVHQSDLLVIVGARVADRAVSQTHVIEKNATVIHIDVDPAEIGKNLGTTIPLVGDAKQVLRQIIDGCEPCEHAEWVETMKGWKADYKPMTPKRSGFIYAPHFVKRLCEKLDDDAVYTADVGQNQMWSAGNYIVKSGKFLTTGGMGTMSYALPAAMGAKAACPDKQVVAVAGDGGFQMSMMEWATIQQFNIPVKQVVMHNNYLGLVREYQHNNYHDRYSGVDLTGSPDLEKIAAAYGVPFIRLADESEMEAALDKFLALDGPCLMEILIDPMELVK